MSGDLAVSHRSEVASVPAVEKYLAADCRREVISTVDLALGLEQKSGETWVWISPEDDIARGLFLTFESCRRLVRRLESLIDADLPATDE